MPFFRDIFRCFFVWKVAQATMEEIVKADAIVTMAHGLLRDGTPSPGDKILADVMLYLHRRFPEKPIIPQEPVALAAPDIPYTAVAKAPKGNVLGGSTMTWNTRTVARFQAEVCHPNGWETVALIATPWTQPRAKWELERCGLHVLVVPVPPYSKKLYAHRHHLLVCARRERLLPRSGADARPRALSLVLAREIIRANAEILPPIIAARILRDSER